MSGDASRAAFERARLVLPGGVDSPVRAFRAVGGSPVFVRRGEGARIEDLDGRRLVDLVCAYGPLILGHAHPAVVEAVREQAGRGASFGMPTEAETELAELVCRLVPSAEMVRFVSSGTEAAMSAVRLARAATGRELVVKFAGGYHGHADHLLVDAGSAVATLGIPGSPGVPAAFAALTAVLEYNAVPALEALFAERGEAIAAVIVEPVAGNMGVVEGTPEFLAALRDLTRRYGAVLIFDEVITGFRLGLGGVQESSGVTPDLTCLGKIVGGGLPLAAYCGRADLMGQVAPEGPVYQAGTLSGNPLATAAGLATLRTLLEDPPHARLDAAGARLEAAIGAAAGRAGVEVTVNRRGSMLTPFLRRGPVRDLSEARGSDLAAYARLFTALLDAGVHPPPSQLEAWFVSTAHDEGVLAEVATALVAGFAAVSRG
ncbi:MAG TPA: glutamate-1-semialdehyde 2,1-aminomutase [Candidatus Dormibacteraeota bacterium]|jgi:glutamate-1-semialdehyde 2,1-aminomutase|nr:glutamate-1-semialdehyde 2,1-aminomutase [Candidatus Dormibacteraeota bacterium]